jgi:hypothetical protein
VGMGGRRGGWSALLPAVTCITSSILIQIQLQRCRCPRRRSINDIKRSVKFYSDGSCFYDEILADHTFHTEWLAVSRRSSPSRRRRRSRYRVYNQSGQDSTRKYPPTPFGMGDISRCCFG